MSEEATEETKKTHKVRKFFLFAAIAGLIAGVVKFMKGRRGGGFEEDEWRELPPPAESA